MLFSLQWHFPSSEAAAGTPLLVDVAVALALLPVLEQGSDGDDKQGLNGDHAKDSGEDVVNEGVAEGSQGRDAALNEGGSGGARARRVHDEGRRRAIQVTAALELARK